MFKFVHSALARLGIISEDCGSPVGTLVCVLVGLMGRIPIAKKSSHRVVDQGIITLLSPFLDKKVVGTHRWSPCIAPARGDASIVVQSGCVWPALIQDGKLIGCVNRQGKNKQLTFVMETNEKSQQVDFTRKHYINVVNIHKMIPHALSDYLSEFVLSTFISKGGKPIETITGLVRKQDKQVAGTQRSITGVVSAQGHIPVVRSGFERSTLIQKDSKSVGFKKPQVTLKFFSGSSSSPSSPSLSDDSSFHHLQQHVLSMKPIRNEDTDKIEETTTTAAGCHGAANNFESKDVVEKGSQVSFLSKGYVYQMITLFESKRSNIVFEKESQKSFFSKGKNYSIRTNPLFESEQPNLVFESNSKPGPIGESKNSTNIHLRCKQDRKVDGIHRTSPCLAPVQGDASVIVRSGFLQLTLIQDDKLIGCENQGKDKLLTFAMESHKVDLTRNQSTNALNIHKMTPLAVSECDQPIFISKGGKPIESQKHKAQKKQLISVMESRTNTGLVRKQRKQVVGTLRTITRVVPAQGHIPAVRSRFERSILIQKDSKLIGSKKLQVSLVFFILMCVCARACDLAKLDQCEYLRGSEKLLSSVLQSKKPGIISSSRKNGIKVVGCKDVVDERSLKSVSKKKPGKIDPSRKIDIKVVGTRKDLVYERSLQSVSKRIPGNIDPSRLHDIKVVGTRNDFVDERSLQSVSKQRNVKTVPQVSPYKGGKISSSELKPQWRF
uniref:uncharacterized protein LOC122587653 n=1 Tax=Erigeron canadensis TaxID=72917 RepID=UPI001CB9C515|nr:uncharacterized protein LOC122587653 [Erigeron canadensis]